jgi:hypothetical protein
MEPKVKIVIFDDESFKVCSELQAKEYENNPEWLMTLDLNWINELAKEVK